MHMHMHTHVHVHMHVQMQMHVHMHTPGRVEVDAREEHVAALRVARTVAVDIGAAALYVGHTDLGLMGLGEDG